MLCIKFESAFIKVFENEVKFKKLKGERISRLMKNKIPIILGVHSDIYFFGLLLFLSSFFIFLNKLFSVLKKKKILKEKKKKKK